MRDSVVRYFQGQVEEPFLLACIWDDLKRYSRLTKHQTKAYCFIVKIVLDSKYLFIDLDFDHSNPRKTLRDISA